MIKKTKLVKSTKTVKSKTIKKSVSKPKVQEEFNCIHKINPVGGFYSNHTHFCGHGQCEEDATHHVYIDYWCANVCEKCMKAQLKAHRGAEVVGQVYVGD